ncbi:MAG: ATP-binding protein [Thermodesulfobacteriota bacterium]
MFSGLLRRWQIIPTWAKVTPVALLLAGLSLAHAHLLETGSPLLATVQRLFFLPLFLSCLLFGLRGGLSAALLISLNYYQPIIAARHDPAGGALTINLVEVGLYFLTGLVIGLIVDRERRETARLKQAQDLALLGQAAAAVAHELKTPLVAIGGFAQRMLRDLEPDHPHHRPLGIIVEQAGHMERLLREMLDYSRPLSLRLASQDLGRLMRECADLTEDLAEAQGVRVVCDPGPESACAQVDAARLKQVTINLLQNAIQASERGGQVWLCARQDDKEVRLEVSDQGCGIPREDQERVFSPFFTTKRQGTGLGLAICRKIVVAHGGSLELASQPGQGSTFRVRLPRSQP